MLETVNYTLADYVPTNLLNPKTEKFIYHSELGEILVDNHKVLFQKGLCAVCFLPKTDVSCRVCFKSVIK